MNCNQAFGEYNLGDSGKSVECTASDGGYTFLNNYLSDLILISSVGLILSNINKIILGVTVSANGKNTVGSENPCGIYATLAFGNYSYGNFYLTNLSADVTVSIVFIVVCVTCSLGVVTNVGVTASASISGISLLGAGRSYGACFVAVSMWYESIRAVCAAYSQLFACGVTEVVAKLEVERSILSVSVRLEGYRVFACAYC